MTGLGSVPAPPEGGVDRHRSRPDPAWAWSLARLAVRRSREATRALTRRPGVAPIRSWVTVRAGDGLIRPLAATDSAAWSAGMRANESRMRPWWDIEGDWAVATDHIAFASHYTQWARRARTGRGLSLALCSPEGLVGEMLVWNFDAQAGTAELGLWARPESLSGRVLLALLSGALDQLYGRCGATRLDAPVAVGNASPRKVLEHANFANEGTLSQWRRLHGEMVDYDMYGLTPQRWEVGRRHVYRLCPWEPVFTPPG